MELVWRLWRIGLGYLRVGILLGRGGDTIIASEWGFKVEGYRVIVVFWRLKKFFFNLFGNFIVVVFKIKLSV